MTMKKLISYYQDSKKELSKVLFPTWSGDDSGVGSVRAAAISVVIVVTIVTLFLALVDLALSWFVMSIIA